MVAFPRQTHAQSHTDGRDDIRDAAYVLKGIARFDPASFSVVAGAVSLGLAILTDMISEKTADAGVTIEGVLLKDSTIGPVGNIELGDGTERTMFPNTDDKINLGTATNAFKSLFLNDGLHLQSTSPAQLTGNTDDWAVGQYSFVRLDTDGAYDLTGVSGGLDGHVLVLVNVAASTMTVKNQDASSAAANRFQMNTGADLALAQHNMMLAIYDGVTERWRAAEL